MESGVSDHAWSMRKSSAFLSRRGQNVMAKFISIENATKPYIGWLTEAVALGRVASRLRRMVQAIERRPAVPNCRGGFRDASLRASSACPWFHPVWRTHGEAVGEILCAN